MGQVHVQVILTNHREEIMARLGQLAPEHSASLRDRSAHRHWGRPINYSSCCG